MIVRGGGGGGGRGHIAQGWACAVGYSPGLLLLLLLHTKPALRCTSSPWHSLHSMSIMNTVPLVCMHTMDTCNLRIHATVPVHAYKNIQGRALAKSKGGQAGRSNEIHGSPLTYCACADGLQVLCLLSSA